MHTTSQKNQDIGLGIVHGQWAFLANSILACEEVMIYPQHEFYKIRGIIKDDDLNDREMWILS